MKLKIIVIVLSLFLVACGSSKKTNFKETKTEKSSKKKRNQIKLMLLSLLQKPIRVQNISMEEPLKRE
jgi:thioredoxin-related protein